MERVLEELDGANAEIEKLKAEFKTKAEMCERLKRTQNEQLTKIQEANAKIEKQALELNEKLDEISSTKQMCEELKSNMKDKEAIIRHLSSSNDKLSVSCDEKLRKRDEEKREMMVSLDKANSKNMDHEQKLRAYEEEVKSLKSFLSDLEKCLEVERKSKMSGELRERDDMLLKQEEEKWKVEDQLKWKKEHFKHLEEAHEKLRCQFQQSKKDWEMEKSTLIDEISTLQTNLDSQTRITEGLQSRLQMCNQTLTHEESKRKYLEVQLSETKESFGKVLSECEEAKSEIECLTSQRDKDNACLRDLLGTKEIHKEMKYQLARLEQQNQELKSSIKEMQEAQIQEGGTSSSLSKLRNKLKGLELTHRDCSKNLRVKEAEWNSELEKMEGDLSYCRFELERKDRTIKELNKELEGYRSLVMHLELQNEEKSLMLLILKSEIPEVQLKFFNIIADMELKKSEREEEVSRLMKQLKNAALVIKAHKNIDEDHGKMASLLRKVESLNLTEDQKLQLQDENEMLKGLAMDLEWLNEEKSLVLFVLKLGISEAQFKLANEMENMDLENNNREEEASLHMKQLELKSDALLKAETKIEKCHEKIKECQEEMASLLREVESLSLMEQQQLQLQNELERHKEMQTHLGLQNEEKSLILLVLDSGISEAQSKIANEVENMALKNIEREDEIKLLLKQLETKSGALVKAEEKMESLLSTVESLSLMEQNQLQMQAELRQHKEKLKESYVCQIRLKEQVLLMENDLEKVHELEFELQVWKSIAEQLKAKLEENQKLRKQVEASLLAQIGVEVTLKQEKESLINVVEERQRRIDALEREIMVLDREFKTREDASENVSGRIHKEIECLEQECVRRELEGVITARFNGKRSSEHENSKFQRLLEKRDEKIDDLELHLMLMEEMLKSSTASFNLLHKAWEKLAIDGVMREIDIQEKIHVIAEMESDFSNLEKKLELLQISLFHSKKKCEEIEVKMKAKQLEIKKLTSDLRTSVNIIDRMESEKATFLDYIGSLFERITELSNEDMQLTGVWERIVQNFEDSDRGIDLKVDNDEIFYPSKENVNTHPPSMTKRVDAIVDERSPLRALNS